MAKRRRKDLGGSDIGISISVVTVVTILVALLIIVVVGAYQAINTEFVADEKSERTEQGDDLCPEKFRSEVAKAAKKYGIEKERIYAVMMVESSLNPDVVSYVGARGLMQMMPSTYEELCQERGREYDPDDLFIPSVSIDYGVYYLKWLYDILGDWDLAHMAYNAGINNVQKWQKNPEYCQNGEIVYIPFEETRNYMEKIHQYYSEFKG